MTPLLKQYLNIKKEYEDAILLFHIGDFYETFYDDAKKAAGTLDITLTSKPMGKGVRVPLAGIPIKAADSYIEKLVKEGFKVAICEQVEEAGASGGLVKREVVEVITSGTIMRPSLLKEEDNNYLVAVFKDKDSSGFSFSDISTGEFQTGTINNLEDEIMRLSPREIIIPEGSKLDINSNIAVTEIEPYRFESEYAAEKIKDHFGILNLDSFGLTADSPAVRAAGALLSYFYDNQKKALNHIKSLSKFDPEEGMILDGSTIKNLEIIQKINGMKKGSLLHTINRTKTSMGARLLKKWLLFPLTDIEGINRRLDGIDEFIFRRDRMKKIRDKLDDMGDIERITGRISTGRASPRDLIALKSSLQISMELKEILEDDLDSEIFEMQKNNIFDTGDVTSLIEKAIVEDPPARVSDGGIFKKGYSDELDEVKEISSEGKSWILDYEKEQRKETGIDSLKVGYNSVVGYYIEITKANLDKVPMRYTKKQTLTNSERFITEELKEFESKILTAEEKQKEIEKTLYNELIEKLQDFIEEFESISKAVSVIDVLTGLSLYSHNKNYTRPVIKEEKGIYIDNGRHPVVEELIAEGEFIPNDANLRDSEKIVILTGPNMSGKSTYLRQIALIVILAQIGCFVPADDAKIGIIDKIFTRIGASDDLSRGVSTFLAEMNETANILHNISERSLVLLDEVGRGTSTYDGLSIAWAVVEYLHSIPQEPLVLFATHYHELTELEEFYRDVVNYNVRVKETEDEVIFVRKVSKGSSDRSYGVEVAKLAGLPQSVIKRASELLNDLRQDDRIIKRHPPETRQLSLFEPENVLLNKLKTISLDEISPRRALDILYDLKSEIDEDKD